MRLNPYLLISDVTSFVFEIQKNIKKVIGIPVEWFVSKLKVAVWVKTIEMVQTNFNLKTKPLKHIEWEIQNSKMNN